MRTPLRLAVSQLTGWVADRRVPRFLRAPLYRAYARGTGADIAEARPPLDGYPSLTAFFVRRLVEGARTFPASPEVLPSPVDGTVQAVQAIEDGTLLQAKGRPYDLEELLGGPAPFETRGGHAITIYLSPRDYHRIHAPEPGHLRAATWIDGARFSVAPKVLAGRDRVLATNERCVLQLDGPRGPFALVLVGALNVGRIRVVGVEPGHRGPLEPTRPLERGDELARFELGSTIVLVLPPGSWTPDPDLVEGRAVAMGSPLARTTDAAAASG